MKTSRTKLAAGLIACVLAGGVLSAQDRSAPESLLPPGFGDPAPTPTPTPRPADPGSAPAPGAPLTVQPLPAPSITPTPTPTPSPTYTPEPLTAQDMLEYELPAYARRSLARVGASGDFAASGFGDADGVYVERLMRSLDAPIASRWLSIALRRMLVSRIDTPARVNGADFAAERAWLLLRMGESVAARDVAQAVDLENHTPKLYQIAMQAALATGDPAALCPLEPFARETSNEAGWALAEAMCAGMAGEPRRAGQIIDALRRSRVASGTDLLLAEKVLGAGAQGRRAVTIEWDDVQQLTAWRYGLAMATGVDIPEPLLQTVGPHVRSWLALSPIVPVQDRIRAAEAAAGWGVLSNLALVDLWGAVEESDTASAIDAGAARDLRTAYSAGNAAERIAAMRSLWSAPEDARARFARSILTARAATRIVPSAEQAGAADALVASMLTGGFDLSAARWRPFVPEGSDAWAMIALTDPQAGQPLSANAVESYAASATDRKAQLFLAGMAGTGRIAPGAVQDLAQTVGVPIGAQNAWTQAIRRAANDGQAATVILLAGVGMQTREWAGVSPLALYHITAALNAVGLEGEARMIAAEAIARS